MENGGGVTGRKDQRLTRTNRPGSVTTHGGTGGRVRLLKVDRAANRLLLRKETGAANRMS